MSDIQERINKLSDQQKMLLAKHMSVESNMKKSGQGSSNHSIVAYFVSDEPIAINELRESLKDKLPEYMIPSKFIQLDKLPKLPNGKIDVNLLKPPAEESFKKSVSVPQTDAESKLVAIWEEVLGFHPIGVHDNFFEIGGDSILSIQIVTKARQKGIFLAPNQIFEHQTISELALFAKSENKKTIEEKIVGNVSLLPIQHWFFEEHKKAPHHWNQAILFDVPKTINTDILQKSIEYLIGYHDTLRTAFQKTEDGWNAFVAEHAKNDAFRSINLNGILSAEIDSTIESKSIELQANQDLSKATPFQTLFFECGQLNKNKLLLVAHHLVVDAISWQILVSDLESIYLQLSRDEEIVLPSKTTSYHKWGNQLNELSMSGEFDDEIEFWKSQRCLNAIPTDNDSNLPIYEKSIKTIMLKMDLVTTENLVKNSNEAYRTKTEELLITGLMLALEQWANIKSLCLGVERHGRNYSKLDLTNTVGWFTTYFPVALNIEDGTNFTSSIIAIKEKFRSIPNEGLGYGVLRYLKKIEELTHKPSIIFNFLGNQKPFDSSVLGSGIFVAKGVRSPESERYHLLEINAFIEEGQLNFQFSYSEQFHKPETIHNLLALFKKALHEVIEHCTIRETREYSPSDFPEAELNQDDLSNLLNQIN